MQVIVPSVSLAAVLQRKGNHSHLSLLLKCSVPAPKGNTLPTVNPLSFAQESFTQPWREPAR
jgi:hypothetical protein